MILNMGIVQLNNLKDYWSTDETTNFPSLFRRDRFFQIFGMLYVVDPDSTNKRGKIQPLLDLLCPLFETSVTPSKQIAIDESVITFKGRVSFRQYLKGKPHPWGNKAIVLSDSKTGYLQRVCVYYGKETQLIDSDHPHTVRVVQTLVGMTFMWIGFTPILSSPLSCPRLVSRSLELSNQIAGVSQRTSRRRGRRNPAE